MDPTTLGLKETQVGFHGLPTAVGLLSQNFTMLPEPLSNTYKKYKYDTAVVASWLVQTAKRLGYDKPLAPTAVPITSTSGRLKGKARKEAAKSGKSADSGQQRRFPLAIKDFVPLAEFIAAVNKPKPVLVPAPFATTIHRVIRVRKSFSTQLEACGTATDARSDERHSYFVGILEKVRDILKPRMAALDLSGMEDTLPRTDSNLFNILEVYETSEAFLNAPEVEVPMPDYEPEPEDTFEDAFFAFSALIQDAISLRRRVRSLWSAYKESSLHLAPVAVASNIAIDLVRRMEEDVAPLLVKCGSFTKWMWAYYGACCHIEGKDAYHKERSGDEINFDTYEIADACMFIAWQCLDGFKSFASPGHIQCYNGHFGRYNPSLNQDEATNRLKYQQDKTALLEVLPDLVIVGSTLKANPVEDEFTRAVHTMIRATDVPFWAAFAAQIYLETLRTLHGPDALRPVAEMQSWNSGVSRTIEKVMEFHKRKQLHIKNWPPSNDANLKMLIQTCKFWSNDPISAQWQRMGLNLKPSTFLHRHMLFCGLWTHYLRTSFHKAGVAFADAWGSVLYSGHLYHAIRLEGLIGPEDRWSDMDLAFKMQTTTGFFVGQPPIDGEGCFKNFCLCMGCSVANWAPHRRDAGHRSPLASKAGPRCLREQGNVSMLFRDQLYSDNTRAGMTADDVRTILKASEWHQECQDGHFILEKDSTSKKTPASKGKHPGGTEETTLSELVLALALALHAEVAEISFDYLTLHSVCVNLLEALRTKLDPELSQWFGPGYLEDQNKLPYVVGYMFMAAASKVVRPGADRLQLLKGAVEPLMFTIENVGSQVQESMPCMSIRTEVKAETDSE